MSTRCPGTRHRCLAADKVVVAEQNLGQLAAVLRAKIDGFVPYQYNEVKGQPFVVADLVNNFEEIIQKA